MLSKYDMDKLRLIRPITSVHTLNPGDTIRIKSLEGIREASEGVDERGNYVVDSFSFVSEMYDYCGKVVTVNEVHASSLSIVEDTVYGWTAGMIEGEVGRMYV